MKISTENYNILADGSIILPDGEYLEFDIEGLRFRFLFTDAADADGNTDPGMTATLLNEGGRQYLLINVRNYNGFFSTPGQMLELGTVGGKKLFVLFSIVDIPGEGSMHKKIFYYTWYQSKF